MCTPRVTGAHSKKERKQYIAIILTAPWNVGAPKTASAQIADPMIGVDVCKGTYIKYARIQGGRGFMEKCTQYGRLREF